MQLSCLSNKLIKQFSISLFIFSLLLTTISFAKPLKAVAAPTSCQPITTTINQAPAQTDPTGITPIKFKVVFSLPITPSTFTAAQIELTGTAPSKSVTGITEIAPNDGTTFEVSVTTTGNGTVIVSMKDAGYLSSVLGATGNSPYGITVDQAGNVYTANHLSSNVTKITPAGVSTNFLGTSGGTPHQITLDAAGNIYITNVNLNNVTKITPAGISSVFSTTGESPVGVTIDSSGNIYTANSGSAFGPTSVTKITPSGVSSLFGIIGSTSVKIVNLIIDPAGNLYTANRSSNNVTKITPSGVATILGNTGTNPVSIGLDSAGNVYTTNFNSNNVTKITPAGISSVLGNTGAFPYGITIDPSGNIYTANSNSNNVTKLTKTGASLVSGCTINNQLATNFAQPSTTTDNIITVDSTPPPITGTPDLATSSDSGSSNTDDITTDTTPSFDIPCQAGSTVTLYDGANLVGTKLCSAANIVSITLTNALTNGTHTITAKQTHPVGVPSETSNPLQVVIVTSVPVPIIDTLTPTSNPTPTVTGRCEDGSGLIVTFNPTNEILNIICDRLNTFTVIPTIQIPVGPYTVSITQNDLLGNITESGLSNGVIVASDPTLDSDNDGITDGIEASGPNNGDFNSDGIPDLSQYFVRGMKGTNNEFVGLITDYVFGGSCGRGQGGIAQSNTANTNSTAKNQQTNKQAIPVSKLSTNILDGIPESTLSAQDSTYSYPKGLIKYTTNCLDQGATIPIELYFSNQTDSPNLKVRKYKNGTYSDLPGAIKTQITLGGLPTVKVTYNITDGGELDEDNLANGEIVDPVGLALLDTPIPPVTPTPTNPATGNGGTSTTTQPTTQTTTKSVVGLIRTGGRD